MRQRVEKTVEHFGCYQCCWGWPRWRWERCHRGLLLHHPLLLLPTWRAWRSGCCWCCSDLRAWTHSTSSSCFPLGPAQKNVEIINQRITGTKTMRHFAEVPTTFSLIQRQLWQRENESNFFLPFLKVFVRCWSSCRVRRSSVPVVPRATLATTS